LEIDGTIPDCWALTPADLVLVMAKNEANRVDFALLLLFYRVHGRFPNEPEEIEPGAVANIARQLGMTGVAHDGFNTADRTWKRHRAEIRAMFGYREATVADAEMVSDWLRDQAAVAGGVPEHLAALLDARCRELLIEPPSTDRADRIVRAAIYAHDERFCATILGRLTPTTTVRTITSFSILELNKRRCEEPFLNSLHREACVVRIGRSSFHLLLAFVPNRAIHLNC
jgi:hypothetical protein